MAENKDRCLSEQVRKTKTKKELSNMQLLQSFQPPSGFGDCFPDEMRRRRWLFGKWRSVAETYRFEEYDMSSFESQALYLRKQGKNPEASVDDLVKEMYNFDGPSIGGEVGLALRPEATTSMARMILLRQCEETGIGRTSPVPVTRWFSIPLCWRNETPQKGRKREFYQWNMDIIGVRAIYAECELISAIIAFYRSVGLTAEDVVIRLNSRKVMQAALKSLGIAQETTFLEVARVIDKFGKPGQDTKRSLTALVGADIAETLMKLIRCNTFEEFTAFAKLDCEGDVLEFSDLLEALEGYSDWWEYDPKITRGLEYYDGAVWESFARNPALFQRALCGGGRYNKLMGNLGSRVEVPAVGFGIGDKPIFELLAAKGCLPKELNTEPLADFGVVPFSPNDMAEVVKVADLLRAACKRVVTCLEPQKARREGPLEYARRQGDIERARQWENRLNARRIVVVGAPDEQRLNMVRIVDLLVQPSAEWRVPINSLQEVDIYLAAGAAASEDK